MRLWRISEWLTLDGVGGMRFGGRWHKIGRPIIYSAESSALAMLEMLVRQPRTQIPPPYQLLEIDASDDLEVEAWPDVDAVPDKERSTAWGNNFLMNGKSPLARVPSAVAPQSWNYLLNPLHPDASQVTIIRASRWSWDARLFER